MAGRMLLICRLLTRGLRRHRTENVLLLVAITAATATMTLGLTLTELVTRPYERTRAATAGPDLVVEPGFTGPKALDALARLASLPAVTEHSGPYPLAFLTLTARDTTVRVIVEGRDQAPAAVNRPAVTDGTWVRPGGVVVERTFADALGMRLGDTVSVDGHPLHVTGFAVTAARPVYPQVHWHLPGGNLVEKGGLVWVDHGDITTLAGDQPLSYTLNLKLVDRDAGAGAIRPAGDVRFRGWSFRSARDIAHSSGRQNRQAETALVVGAWLLTGLAVVGIAGIVAGRVIARRRRVGLLKAIGAGPGVIAAVHLAEYLVIGLAAAGAGLAIGWFTAPVLFRSSAGFVGSVGVKPPLHVVVTATALALALAVAATLGPVLRAAATSTIQALADAPTPPRRRRWTIWLSRRLPTALLIGVRINARRPHRARLVTVNTLITTAALAAVLTILAQDDDPLNLGYSELPDPRNERTLQAMLIVAGVACFLALLNTIVSTWTAVLDTQHPLAVARALGATPAQAGLGLAVAQLIPAVPGVAAGIPFGIGLYLFFDGERYPPAAWTLTTAAGVLIAVATLTAAPALAAARRPVADTLRSTAT
ncbi:FtsX-like permease family protein [Micromonospora sp. NPDC048935]|uniref:FtsX-like permease family protein n=1 Tax=Micromonospora sp. NPDC048935 TaxID=3364262 RepID=UPI003713F7DE